MHTHCRINPRRARRSDASSGTYWRLNAISAPDGIGVRLARCIWKLAFPTDSIAEWNEGFRFHGGPFLVARSFGAPPEASGNIALQFEFLHGARRRFRVGFLLDCAGRAVTFAESNHVLTATLGRLFRSL